MSENPMRKPAQKTPIGADNNVTKLPNMVDVLKRESAEKILNLISHIRTLTVYPGDAHIRAENGSLRITYDSDGVMLVANYLLEVGYGGQMHVEGNTIVIENVYQTGVYADEEVERIVRYAFFDQS